MSKFKRFICDTEPKGIQTLMYDNWSIVNSGIDSSRRVYVIKDNKTLVWSFYIALDTNKACLIDSVMFIDNTRIFDWFIETCSRERDYVYEYDTWEEFDEFMQKLVNYVQS